MNLTELWSLHLLLMTIVYVISAQRQNDDYHTIVRPLYIDAFKAKYSEAKTRMQKDYQDRLTDTIKDVMIQLSVNVRDHAVRFFGYIKHPNYPTTNKVLTAYDDAKLTDDLDPAYYLNAAARARLGADPAFTDNTREEAEAQGFFPEERE